MLLRIFFFYILVLGHLEHGIFKTPTHIMIGYGIAVDIEKISAIMDWSIPTNVSKLHSFMRLVGYYHHFMKDFS